MACGEEWRGLGGGVLDWLSHSFTLFCSSTELAERGRKNQGADWAVFLHKQLRAIIVASPSSSYSRLWHAHQTRTVFRVTEEWGRGVARDGDRCALLGRRAATQQSLKCVKSSQVVAERAMRRCRWSLLNYPERTAHERRRILPKDCTTPTCHRRRKSRRTKRLLQSMRRKWKVGTVQACAHCYSAWQRTIA